MPYDLMPFSKETKIYSSIGIILHKLKRYTAYNYVGQLCHHDVEIKYEDRFHFEKKTIRFQNTLVKICLEADPFVHPPPSRKDTYLDSLGQWRSRPT